VRRFQLVGDETGIDFFLLDYERFHVPFSLEDVPRGKFVDRPSEMAQLEQVLLPQDDVKPQDERQKILVLYGLGGIGKTQLAAEFSRKHQTRFSSFFWLDGSSDENLKQSIAKCASRISTGQVRESSTKYLTDSNSDIDDVVEDFVRWLSKPNNRRWLLIFDNVDREYNQEDPGTKNEPGAYDISHYIPTVDHGSILVTTRLATLQQLGESLSLRSVDREQARAIFRKCYGQDFSKNHICQNKSGVYSYIVTDFIESDELLHELHGLPLALAQAAAYMNETGISFASYMEVYRTQWKELMGNDKVIPLRNYRHGSINTTWMISYYTICSKNKKAGNLLLLWSYFDNKTFPYRILEAAAANSRTFARELFKWLGGAVSDKHEFLELIRLLRSYSLVEALHEISGYATHPVVHEWAFQMQSDDQKRELSRITLLALAYGAPRKNSTTYYQLIRQLLPHIDSWTEREASLGKFSEAMPKKALEAMHDLGYILRTQGLFNKSEKMYERALKEKENLLGPNHKSTLDTVNSLGTVYTEQGRFGEAEKIYNRALKDREMTLGPNHQSTLDTVNDLGLLYANMGRLDEAETMYNRALTGTELLLGPNHESTLDTVNNLGLLYADQDKLDEAEKMYNRALKGTELLLGPNHESTLLTIDNLATVYAKQKRFDDAEKMYNRVLEGKQRVLGPNHQSTLDTLNNLGLLYVDQRRFDEAENMYNSALGGKEKLLGPNHHSTLTTVNNLALLYHRLERFGQAEEMYNRVIKVEEVGQGLNRNSTFTTINNLGLLYDAQGRLDKAEKMYNRALAGKESVLGPNHQSTLNIVNNLASLYEDQERLDEAEKMYTRVLEGREKTLGPSHRLTLKAINNLAFFYKSQRRFEDANAMNSRVRENQPITPPHNYPQLGETLHGRKNIEAIEPIWNEHGLKSQYSKRKSSHARRIPRHRRRSPSPAKQSHTETLSRSSQLESSVSRREKAYRKSVRFLEKLSL
jgi:tetratricopeptide (TPR) repeat protein